MADIVLTIDPDDTSFALHDRANGRRVLGFDAPVPETDSQWAYSADTEGERRANLRYRNREITVQVLLDKSTAALLEALENTLGQKVGKLAREGGELRFTYPTGTAITFNVLEASMRRVFDIADMIRFRAQYEISFICEPFGLGTETDLGDNTETTLPALIFTEAMIPGDVPALGRLVIDEDDAEDQWWLTWGVQSRYYSSSANAALFYEAEGRTALGGSATAVGPSGASGGGSNVMRNTALTGSYLAIMSTQATGGGAHLSHVGSFRVYARVQTPTTNAGTVSVALEWGETDFLSYTTNPPVDIPTEHEGRWRYVDLGLVKLTAVTSGTQRWEGRIIAKSTTLSDDIDIDYLLLVPVDEGSGIVSGIERVSAPTSYSAQDSFAGTTSGNALNARSAPTGGTWATSGDATDFSFNDSSISVGSEGLGRAVASATNGRFAILGSTNYAAVTVEVLMTRDGIPSSTGHELRQGLIARWTDSSNYLKAHIIDPYAGDGTDDLVIVQTVAGVPLTIAAVDIGTNLAVWGVSSLQRLRLTVTANGIATVQLYDSTDRYVVASCSGYSSALATGGTLATGKPGIWDYSATSTHGRYYDEFAVWVPAVDAAVFASQSLEVRSDRVVREDSSGALWARPSSYQGDYLLVPPSGAEARTTRVVVKASRNDPSVVDPSIDDISAKLFVTPRYLVVPAA